MTLLRLRSSGYSVVGKLGLDQRTEELSCGRQWGAS
jgi:hypothetical protein